ncbi:MAG: hypothetical protein LLF96_01895 [Eubacteriales bacterium]|nr:hypothetical protein [Eubacteriales bacterium]
MKKLLAVLLAFALLGSSAIAEKLTIDLATATIDELTAAQATIGNRISELRAAQAPSGETITLTGNGTTIQSNVVVTQVPARVVVKGLVQVTFTGGDYDLVFNSWQLQESCESLTDAGTYELLIEGDGDWTVSIEPLKEGGKLECSGAGPYVSDFFPLSSSTIVHCVLDASTLDEWSASLYISIGYQFESFDSWTYDTVVGESIFTNPLTLEGDGIIKPVKGRTQYYWIVDVPLGATWSINIK